MNAKCLQLKNERINKNKQLFKELNLNKILFIKFNHGNFLIFLLIFFRFTDVNFIFKFS